MNTDNNDKTPYSAADLLRYVNGQMPPAEMHALEKAALEDPFLADAIDGYSLAQGNRGQTLYDLEQLRAGLQEKTGLQQGTPAIRRIGRWSVAAAFILLAATGTIAYLIINSDRKQATAIQESIARSQPSPAEGTVADSMPPEAQQDVAMNNAIPRKETTAPARRPAPPTTGREDQAVPENPVAIAAVPQSNAAREETALLRKAAEPATDQASPPVTVLYKQASSATAATRARRSDPVHTFSGKITDALNNPVRNASVLVLNTQLAIETDSNGYFNFTMPDSTAFVAFSANGFETVTSTLNARQTIQHVTLKESRQALGYNTGEVMSASKSMSPTDSLTPINAEPAPGWTAFNGYIGQNKKLPEGFTPKGPVVLSFTIGPNGKPADIRVEQSAGKVPDQEAIRLLTEGPAWNPGFNKTPRHTVTIPL